MYTPDNFTQLTFYYIDGQTESFNVLHLTSESVTALELQQEIRHLLDKPWWILHIPEQTICIRTANILKVEIKPALTEVQGEGVFSDARRVTALTRTALHSG